MANTELKEKWMENYEVIFGDENESEKDKSSDFASLLNSQVNKVNFVEEEVYNGIIIDINSDYVMVDIGYKQEGLISIKEFMNAGTEINVKKGDKVEVYLEKLESTNGNLILSKDKAEIIKAWDKISEACEKGTLVKGTVIDKVKGGLSVDIGVKAFLPGSQIDTRPVRFLDKFIGKTMEFKVIKFNKKRGNIVLSRRLILQEEKGKAKSEVIDQMQEGEIVKGIVKNITDYGAFLDLGGIDGLLHITDISWGRVEHPENILNVGEEIDVKVLKIDQDKERVSLGLKQIQDNPWEGIKNKYVPRTKVSGVVVSIKKYGIFLELDDGIEGLIHVSEMSWVGSIKVPSNHFNIGDKIEAQVIDVDTENKRISLGIKQLQPNPWDDLIKKYKVGEKVKGKIKSIFDFGLFVDVNEVVDALIHVTDISWTKKNINIRKEFQEGQEIEGIILSLDKDNHKFSIGLKQLEEDPWKKIQNRNPVGSIVPVEVVRVTDFGVFVELEKGIEGLIHISELSQSRIDDPTQIVKKGDKINVVVISVDKESKKIALSLKAVKEIEEKSTKDYKQEEAKKSTLGDKMKSIIGIKKESKE